MFRWQPAALAALSVVVLAVCGIVFAVGVNSYVSAQHSFAAAVVATQRDREAVISTTCEAIGANRQGLNAVLAFISSFLVRQAVATRVQEKAFRSLHFPPYRQRLAEAKSQAREFEALKLPVLDCRALSATIQRHINQLATEAAH